MFNNNSVSKEERGKKLVNRIDELLSFMGEKRQTLCKKTGITPQSITNWKAQNSIPNAETIIKIADFFNVDPKWLIFGYIDLPEKMAEWPQSIFERVYHLLLEETKIPNPDFHDVSLREQDKIFRPIKSIISSNELTNWQYNRIMPSYRQLRDIAEHFHKPLSYIADGIDNSIPDYIESVKVPKADYDNYKNYEKYKTLFWSFDAMYEPDKNYISQLIRRLFRLRRFAEGRDFDNDYNLEHPLEAPRQKDPNISDEEYAEMKKKDSHF